MSSYFATNARGTFGSHWLSATNQHEKNAKIPQGTWIGPHSLRLWGSVTHHYAFRWSNIISLSPLSNLLHTYHAGACQVLLMWSIIFVVSFEILSSFGSRTQQKHNTFSTLWTIYSPYSPSGIPPPRHALETSLVDKGNFISHIWYLMFFSES